MAGTAVTARLGGGDNLTHLRALEFCCPGDVLLVDAGGDLTTRWWRHPHLHAQKIGVAGVVVDGAIRDVAEIRSREFPVYARRHSPRPLQGRPGRDQRPSRSAAWWSTPATWSSATRTG